MADIGYLARRAQHTLYTSTTVIGCLARYHRSSVPKIPHFQNGCLPAFDAACVPAVYLTGLQLKSAHPEKWLQAGGIANPQKE